MQLGLINQVRHCLDLVGISTDTLNTTREVENAQALQHCPEVLLAFSLLDLTLLVTTIWRGFADR